MAEHFGAIPILSMTLIQESIAKARLTANSQRKLEASKRLDYYKGDQLGHLDDVLNDQFKHPKRLRLQKEFSNIVKRLVDAVSVVYKQAPYRALVGADKKPLEGRPADAYAKMCEQAKINSIMKVSNRYANLLSTIGVQAVWRDEQLQLDVLTPDILNVVQDPINPTKAAAVIIEQSFPDTVTLESPGNPYGVSRLYVAWTNDGHMVYDQQGNALKGLANDAGINPYGMIPIVWMRDSYPSGYFWNESGQDLIVAQESLNVKLTELNQLIKMQSFSIPVIIGDPPSGGITVDPSNWISIPLADNISKGQPDFKFVSPDPKIADLLEAIKETVLRIADAWGVNPAEFKLQGSPSSGLSLKMQNIRLLERRQDDVELYNGYEKDLFRVMRAVWNAHVAPVDRIPEDAEISVNFAELQFPEDPTAEDARWITRINQNVVNRAQWLMAIDPDVQTVEEAEAKLAENARINSASRGADMQSMENGLTDALGVKKPGMEDEGDADDEDDEAEDEEADDA